MSSSGVIYAIIVGAWAVYLVPMWLRREDELNRARETQRYATAIKVLANKEAFERRFAQPGEEDEALPLAAGQGSASIQRTANRATSKETPNHTTPAKRPTVAAATTAPRNRDAVTANVAANTHSARATRERAATAAEPQRSSAVAMATRSRTGLMARRRRVVALLFAISTLGALVSADLGARYLWAMAIPAVLLSAYIVRLRRDERIRAAARAAKRSAAQEARNAELARAKAEATQVEAAEAEAARAGARAEAEHRRRTEAARRRASAAARARAQAFTQEAPDLRRASNG